jgi:hypothetical protein
MSKKKKEKWIKEKIEHWKDTHQYWFERKTSQVTVSKLKDFLDEKCIDEEAPIIFQSVISDGNPETEFYSYEFWESDGQIVISLDQKNGHYGKKVQMNEDNFKEELNESLEEEYEWSISQ